MVVDASVAVKWFVPEAGRESALQLLLQSGTLLCAPALIQIEVAAALTRRYRENPATGEEIKFHLCNWQETLRRAIPRLHDLNHDFDAAVALSMYFRHPLQDCLYLALAQRLQLPLATADKRLAQHAETAQIPCHFIHSTH
jgi:predicted nucleic acid-binding protein